MTPPSATSKIRQACLGFFGVAVGVFALAACSNTTFIESGASTGDTATAERIQERGESDQIAEGTPRVIGEAVGEDDTGSAGSGTGDSSPTTLADLTVPLGSAQVNLDRLTKDAERANEQSEPAFISIPSLGVENAIVNAVGVEANGDMEIPPADQVGWYRFGPRPGEAGSAVIAGHIAYNGVDGVFRYLADLEVGTNFFLTFDDSSIAEYVVTDLQTYLKTELPRDDLFDPSGPPRLVLVTCGGSFNYDASSYESNVVAYAIPLRSLDTQPN